MALLLLVICILTCVTALREDQSLQEEMKFLSEEIEIKLRATFVDGHFGWSSSEIAEAVIALALNDEMFFKSGHLISKLILKDMQLELAGMLLQQKEYDSAGELALFINALVATCHNPRNFFGRDLISKVRHMTTSSDYEQALVSLSLCNAGAHPSKNVITHLNGLLNDTRGIHSELDMQSMTLMALTCVKERFPSTYIRTIFNKSSEMLLERHKEADGSFGNLFTTALVVQALIAVDREESFNMEQIFNHISNQYKESDQQFNVLTSFLVLPLLKYRPLSSLWKVHLCYSKGTDRPNTSDTDDMKNDLWSIISEEEQATNKSQLNAVSLTLLYPNHNELKNISISTVVFIPDGVTLLDAMDSAALSSQKFKYTSKQFSFGAQLTSVAGHKNNPKTNHFWIVYQVDKTQNLPVITNKGISEIKPEDGDHFLLWYKKM